MEAFVERGESRPQVDGRIDEHDGNGTTQGFIRLSVDF